MADYMLHLTQEENIVLGAATVRRLIEGRDGNAALLYLCLARSKASNADALRAELGWTEATFAAAEDKLRSLGLIRRPQRADAPETPADADAGSPSNASGAAAPSTAVPARTAVPPETALPEYTRKDVADALEQDAAFAAVLREAERKLGRLSEPSVKKLLGLYDYLGLPADVIMLLFNHCIERRLEQFGRPPTMRDIEREGYAWARRELFTSEAADAYLRRERERRSRFTAYMDVLGLRGRAPAPSEEKYLGGWVDWGFPPETVAIAYDKTVLNCGEFRWAYCNGILRRWHEKGLHAPDAVRSEGLPAGRLPAGRLPAGGLPAGGLPAGHRKGGRAGAGLGTGEVDKNAWMDEFLK